MRWLQFLQQTVSMTTAAAAGSAATAAVANPLLGVAVGTAAKKSTEELVAEFLPAQQQALDELLERTRGIEQLLGGIRSDIQTLLDAPWRTALLHIEDAAKHPANAGDELQMARNALYQAWGSANSSAKRALIAQQLSVVYALLGRPEDSRTWLFRSYPEASNGAGEAVASIVASIEDLPRLKFRGKYGSLDTSLPTDVLCVHSNPRFNKRQEVEYTSWFSVFSEPLDTTLITVAETRLDVLKLRRSCALADMPQPWEDSDCYGWSLYGAVPDGRSPWVQLSDGDGLYYIRGEGASRAAVLLADIGDWRFRLDGTSFAPPAQVFVSGSSPELGRWRQEQALPLRWDRGTWWSRIESLKSGHSELVEYKYCCVEAPGSLPVWESGANRQPPPVNADGDRQIHDSWRSA